MLTGQRNCQHGGWQNRLILKRQWNAQVPGLPMQWWCHRVYWALRRLQSFQKKIIIIIGFQNFRAGRAIRVLPFAERIDCVLEFHIGEGRPWSYYDLGDQAINLPLCSPPLHKVSWLSKGKKFNFLVEWSVGPILRWRVGPGHVVVLICENFLNSL